MVWQINTLRTFVFLVSCFITNSYAQPYVNGGRTRHRFAQLNVGLEFRNFISCGTHSAFISNSGTIETFKLKDNYQSRLIIGGTHFWGHADFYISIPVFSFSKSEFKAGVETGAKYFPWRIESNKIRPYLGMSFLSTQFKQGDGAKLIRFKYPVLAGINYSMKKHLFELGSGFINNNSEKYYISKTTSVDIKTNPFWLSFSYKLMFETSLSAERDWQSGKTKWLTDTLSSLNKLSGLTLSVGPSSAFYLLSSKHNRSTVPYIDDHKTTVFPEYGIGYYFHNADLQFNLAFRNIKSEVSAYGFTQIAKRNSWTIEAYKFLFDYNGFAFFAGAAASSENLSVSEMNQQQVSATQKYSGIKPGVIFGWDIRPNRLQAFYLRTNLRYFPDMNVKMSDEKSFSFDQLEFNFIQLVVFPERLF